MNIWKKFYFDKKVVLFECDDKMMSFHEFTLFCKQIGIFNPDVVRGIFQELKDAEGNSGTVSMYLFTYV